MVSRLIEKIQKTKAPICVGLDPMLSYIPEHVTKKAYDEFGETLEGAAQAIWLFNKEIIDATAGSDTFCKTAESPCMSSLELKD